MKKNLISILILALLVVNVVLTTIMLFSVAPANKKTTELVNNIASILNIELSDKTDTEETVGVSIVDSVSYPISEMIVPLKRGDDEKMHVCQIEVAFYMNSKHEDYKEYSTIIASQESLLKGIINDVISKYTLEEAQGDTEMLKADILKEVQKAFESTFIYKVNFSKIIFQ